MNPILLLFLKTVMPPVVRLVALLIPGRDSQTAWLECQNKVHIMELVQKVESIVSPDDTSFQLESLLEKCYSLGAFPALWAVEGLGHKYGERSLTHSTSPSGLLGAPEAGRLPAGSRTMLHAGIGLAFAKECLKELKSTSPADQVRRAVERFLSLCEGCSRKGYAGAAVESLGLVSRFLHGPPMVRRVDRELKNIEPDRRGYLWHGCGRAIYFSPANFIPGHSSAWRGISMCRKEAVDEMSLKNLLAGFGWAVTLVNMRHPEVMAGLLTHHGEFLAGNDGFSNGVMSSVIMRFDTSPDDPYVEPFCEYLPRDRVTRDLWEQQVTGPCRIALQHWYPALKKGERLEEVFHFRQLEAVSELS